MQLFTHNLTNRMTEENQMPKCTAFPVQCQQIESKWRAQSSSLVSIELNWAELHQQNQRHCCQACKNVHTHIHKHTNKYMYEQYNCHCDTLYV